MNFQQKNEMDEQKKINQEQNNLIEEQKNIIDQLRKELNTQKLQCICKKKPQDKKFEDKKDEFIKQKNIMLQQQKIDYKDIKDFQQKYKRIENLGSGSYGSVDLLQKLIVEEKEKDENIEYCVKRFNKDIQLENQENEVQSYYNLKLLKDEFSQYVLNVKETYLDKDKQQISMVIPRALHSFTDEIQERSKQQNFFNPKEFTYLLSCALLGQLSIETIGMVHRDIKLDNLLIMKNGKLVYTDLGTSKRIQSHDYKLNSIFVGTYGYWSPEQINNLYEYKDEDYIQYSTTFQAQRELKSNDLYGLGLCFVQAASLTFMPKCGGTKQKEFCEKRQKWLNFAIAQLEFQELYSQKLIQLLKKMIEADPSKRYNLVQCLDCLEILNDW